MNRAIILFFILSLSSALAEGTVTGGNVWPEGTCCIPGMGGCPPCKEDRKPLIKIEDWDSLTCMGDAGTVTIKINRSSRKITIICE